MRCPESTLHWRRESGAVLVFASAFLFLLTYLALSTVDLATVEARQAEALQARVGARALLDAAIRVVVRRETVRLRQALARGDAPVCGTPGFCGDDLRSLALDESGTYRVLYRTHVRGPAAAGAERVAQDAVSSSVSYRAGHYEIDVHIVRADDNATLANAAMGIHVSEAREEGR